MKSLRKLVGSEPQTYIIYIAVCLLLVASLFCLRSCYNWFASGMKDVDGAINGFVGCFVAIIIQSKILNNNENKSFIICRYARAEHDKGYGLPFNGGWYLL